MVLRKRREKKNNYNSTFYFNFKRLNFRTKRLICFEGKVVTKLVLLFPWDLSNDPPNTSYSLLFSDLIGLLITHYFR